MRILLVLRGAPGCGKTTWVKDNKLTPYTLSFDNVRMLYKSPIQTIYGRESSDRKKDSLVMDTMLSILEERMKSGEFTVIDSVNSRESDLNQYYELSIKYRYKAYIVDFTGIPIEVTKERNKNRMARKRVPDHIVGKIYAEFKTESIPNLTCIKPEQLNEIWPKPICLNKYNKIHHIGDIHGCLDVLKQAIAENGGIRNDEFYVFLGDYTDRGPKNAEVVNYLKSLVDRNNVIICEGNHEHWVWNWANGIEDYTDEFRNNTKPQLEAAGLDKKEIRKFYRKLKECFYYNYHGKNILTCHGGLASIPYNLATVSTHQLIHGVGLYSDLDQIAKTFEEQSEGCKMEIFGHRNPDSKPMKLNDMVYCLEGSVENGGSLRWLTITKTKVIEHEYRNNINKK